MLCRLILNVPNTPANREQLKLLQGWERVQYYTLKNDRIEVITATANVPQGVRPLRKWLRELNLYGIKVVDHMGAI